MEQKRIKQKETEINSQVNREEFEKIKSTPTTTFHLKTRPCSAKTLVSK
jgi:hypothetical protein